MANNNNNNNNNNANNQRMNEHVEFAVRAEEDLFLTGSETSIRRVTAETNYSCLMLKTQRFSSLFRHYAKYHGLRKDELEYYFSNLLQNEDTPESVHLQPGDTIMVRKRRKPADPKSSSLINDGEFFQDMYELWKDETHMDAVFHLTATDEYVRAHKAILTARGDYFRAAFRKNKDTGMQETSTIVVDQPPGVRPSHIECIVEFLYTNKIPHIQELDTDFLITVLQLADQWLLRPLKRVVAQQLASSSSSSKSQNAHINTSTVAALYTATVEMSSDLEVLQKACVSFILQNLQELSSNPEWVAEMKASGDFCLPVLSAAAELIGNNSSSTGKHAATSSLSTRPTKKQRVAAMPNAALSSPTVPDIL